LSRICFDVVNKDFGGQRVLHDFSTVVSAGEMKIILGGSGSGKSTILKMVLGLVRPDSGQVFVDDHVISRMNEQQLLPLRGKIGMVFQEGALFDSLTVGENVGYRLYEENTRSRTEIREIVLEVLGLVALDQWIDKMPSELSGGMKRRVAIARAVIGNPRIMLYDEPTAGLDPITSRAICELMMRLRDLERITSVFVTHDLKAASTIAGEVATVGSNGEAVFRARESSSPENTRFIMIEEGRILLEGTEKDLRVTHNEYIREFLD
jgi:phospholipid/cholesterol/gamma-HCH transport system ATP-binding protein